MGIFTEAQAKDILTKVVAMSKADECTAQLTGQSLSAEGFTTPFDRSITLDVRCFGPWCAGAASGAEILGFVELRDSGPVLTLDPCSSTSFPEPDEAMLNTAVHCMQGGACKPER